MSSAAGRAQYDVLRIMRSLASSDEDGSPETSPRKQGRPTTPRTRYHDVLTSEDILQEKYQELGQLLATQYVERKALSVLETSLLGQKKRRKGRPASAKKESNNGRRRKVRPSSARTFSQSQESRWWYDSDHTDYTEASATSSAKRVSFADDVVSCGESSVVITELTEDDREFEERIKRKPRVTLEEEEMEAREMRHHKDKRDIEHELMRSILKSPRLGTRRGNKSPTRSPTKKSPKQTTKTEKESINLTMTQAEDQNYVKICDEKSQRVETDDEDDKHEISNRKSRKKSPSKDKKRPTTPRDNSKSPRKGKGLRPSSPSKKGSNAKRSPRKKSLTEEEENEVTLESQSPRKDMDPIDNQLMNTQNKHIKTWLRKKDAGLRKQRREERKKEREKLESQQRVKEERAQRLEESETKYDEWVKNKKRVNKISNSISRKVLDDGAKQSQDVVSEITRPISPPRKGRFPAAKKNGKKEEEFKPKTTHDNSIGIVRDYTGDWSESVNCKRDLAAEREQDEEKRQAREAKKRERQQKAAKAAQKKNEPKRSFPRASKSPTKVSPRKNENIELNEQKPKLHGQKPKTKPSNNPFKGMTYDQWVNNKLKSEQERKEAINQKLADPDLEDLIPLLAKHRIQQAKEPSRRVDSGLSRPKSSTAPRKSETSKACDSKDQNPRPYTWNDSDGKKTEENQWKPFPKSNSFLRVNTPTPPGTPVPNRTHSGKSNIGMGNDDILNTVRPEPQGCEIPSPMSHCQNNIKDIISQDNVFMTETLIVP